MAERNLGIGAQRLTDAIFTLLDRCHVYTFVLYKLSLLHAQSVQTFFDVGPCFFLARAGGLVESTGMGDADAHQSFGLEVALHVENESRVAGDDLDPGIFSRVRDDFAAGGAEFVQCCAELAVLERERGTIVETVSVQIDIESRVNSTLTWRNAKCSRIQHYVVG